MKEHRFYRNAYDAHRGTSFVPEDRAIMELIFFEDGLQELRDLGKEAAIPTYEKLWLKHMAAKARCISTMICGPARFPVARAEKYSRWGAQRRRRPHGVLEENKTPPTTAKNRT